MFYVAFHSSNHSKWTPSPLLQPWLTHCKHKWLQICTTDYSVDFFCSCLETADLTISFPVPPHPTPFVLVQAENDLNELRALMHSPNAIVVSSPFPIPELGWMTVSLFVDTAGASRMVLLKCRAAASCCRTVNAKMFCMTQKSLATGMNWTLNSGCSWVCFTVDKMWNNWRTSWEDIMIIDYLFLGKCFWSSLFLCSFWWILGGTSLGLKF